MGLGVVLSNPELVGRTCGECRKWLYQDAAKLSGQKSMRAGKPVPRPAGAKTPCWQCPKIPQGVPRVAENAVELSATNWQALQWWYEARACGMSESERADAVCRRNAAIIERLLRVAEIEQGTTKAVALLFTAQIGKA